MKTLWSLLSGVRVILRSCDWRHEGWGATMTSVMTVEELTSRECWDVLGSVSLGRLLYTSSALPVAQPVRFVLRNWAIMVSVDRATAARALPGGFDFVALQVDDVVQDAVAGRSVTVYGRGRLMEHERRIWAELLGLPGYDGEAVYACIAPCTLSGSRLDFRL
jgi:hypothetical protein